MAPRRTRMVTSSITAIICDLKKRTNSTAVQLPFLGSIPINVRSISGLPGAYGVSLYSCRESYSDLQFLKPMHDSRRMNRKSRPSSGDQVDDQDDERYDQQNVNQGAGNVEAETQQPENEKDDKDCPKHCCSFCSASA